MAKAQCKCKKTECEECPEWIFTFADLVMLMMGFFVILWVLKPAAGNPGAKQELPMDVLISIREAFDYLPNPTSKDPVDVEMLMRKLQQLKPLKSQGMGGKTHEKATQGTDPEVTTVRQGKQVIVGGRLIFDTGQSKLLPKITQSLDQIAAQIRGHRNIVLVKGHASLDDLGEAATVNQKMDLSLRRAQAAADYLTAHGVDPEILRVQGCSTFEPVIQREYQADGQMRNRRVEIEVTATLVEDRQDQKTQPERAATVEPTTRP